MNINYCSSEFLSRPISTSFTIADRCNLATENCEAEGLINFYHLYYCSLSGSLSVYLPFSALILALAFIFSAHVADEHLSPSLYELSKTFSISESLAGVTLLAFGAGATDIFSSISASTGGNTEGI
jgi:solute carrier family 24 (sodium/potassium/calcium exchanger), member 6